MKRHTRKRILALLSLLLPMLLLCACREHHTVDDGIPQELVTLLIAMVPVIELRGAIPYALAQGLSPWAAFSLSVLGNMIPVPFILLFIRKVLEWMKQYPRLGRIALWIENRANSKNAKVKASQMIGLFTFVAIPLPGTGAWTGALIAALMNMRIRRAFPVIFLAVVVAGIIVTLILQLGITALSFLVG